MDFRCSDRSSTPRKVRLLIPKLSIKDDINFNTLLPVAGMAEWISHSYSDGRVVGSKPADGRKGKSEKVIPGMRKWGELEEKR